MTRISFLITHYNRPGALKLCVDSILKLKGENDEIIVSDDSSNQEAINSISNLRSVRIIMSDVNEGLASNINKGIKACSGKYIIYCQEDFRLNLKLKDYLPDLIDSIEKNFVDLIRFSSFLKFNQTISINNFLAVIPRFSWENFFQNFYRYSDHPFLVKKEFYEKYGYYLENTSGRYGETEYGVRLAKSKAIIGITKQQFAFSIEESESTLINEIAPTVGSGMLNKKSRVILRAFRLYLEWLLYNNNKRGLITYRNGRKLSS
ncbi:glycosyltransferase family 2 protein [Nonlabens agnitus]|uniref:Glycosyltransferase 2-like domain-containing protein n=1 Tax=Nonlabens agnitus TaxID=870484 RepID=A0A2S9WU24_9FLAO|nr:glycosyltransferase family 2 protein [Nonlabens agnitus]PRP66981.1 hypothetical protein BST86_07655 [Nonlabens agnitus]